MKIDSFEKKIEKSKEILERLSDPEISLEESMKLYKNGVKELKEAANMLEKAKIEFIELSRKDEESE
ncbi:MAG: exodeoxyribonuclease VII small subunit [Epsilonproteobacteria bacterium]|nr:exodeoxyribonuclease VII small subunit [Campylobacterota bacterium]